MWLVFVTLTLVTPIILEARLGHKHNRCVVILAYKEHLEEFHDILRNDSFKGSFKLHELPASRGLSDETKLASEIVGSWGECFVVAIDNKNVYRTLWYQLQEVGMPVFDSNFIPVSYNFTLTLAVYVILMSPGLSHTYVIHF